MTRSQPQQTDSEQPDDMPAWLSATLATEANAAGSTNATGDGAQGTFASDASQSASSGKVAPPPAKKRKTTASKPRRSAGKLHGLLDFPLDVLREIAAHLDPPTLLHLSRASRAFYSTFASRSFRSSWEAARHNVGLPDLQSNQLTEPQYAALMFGNHCFTQLCGKARASIVELNIFKRLCKECRDDKIDGCGDLMNEADATDHRCIVFIKKTVPNLTFDWEARGILHYQPHVARRLAELSPLFYKASTDTEAVEKRRRAQRDLYADINGFEPEEIELEEYMKKARRETAIMEEDTEALEEWKEARAQERTRANNRLKKQREEAILEELKSLGYKRTDFRWERTPISKLVSQPRALTSAIWSRIKPAIVAHVEAERENRWKLRPFAKTDELRELVHPLYRRAHARHLDTLHVEEQDGVREEKDDLFPSFIDFLTLPSVKPLWHSRDADVRDLDDENWTKIEPEVLRETATFIRRAKLRMIHYLLMSNVISNIPLTTTQDAFVLALGDGGLLFKTSVASTFEPESHVTNEYYGSDLPDDVLDRMLATFADRIVCVCCVTPMYDTTCAWHPSYASLCRHLRDEDRSALTNRVRSLNLAIRQAAVLLETALMWVSKDRDLLDTHAYYTIDSLESVGDRWSCRDGCTPPGAVGARYEGKGQHGGFWWSQYDEGAEKHGEEAAGAAKEGGEAVAANGQTDTGR
ncbi:hypothetical protein JCM10207_003314 [Rhodosporidiobolus poonsookiae]